MKNKRSSNDFKDGGRPPFLGIRANLIFDLSYLMDPSGNG